MKILMATPYFMPKIGGVEKYTHSLAIELQHQGHQVVIVTSGVKGGTVTCETIDGLTVYRLPYQLLISNTPCSLRWTKQLRTIIDAERPDCINGHGPVPFMADVAARVAKRLGIPFVLTYHSGSMLKGKRLPDILIRAYEKYALPAMLKTSAAITTYNPFIATRYPTYAKKIQLAPPGVDTAIFKPIDTLHADRHQLLYVGRMDRTSQWKGVHVLLEALAILFEKDSSYTLRLVGSGNAIADYQAQAARLGISDQVTFVGERFGTALADEYRQAGVCILPSITESESFGIVLIEAMAAGTPAVASNIGGMPAVIQTTGGGLLAEPGDAMDLAATIKMITDNPDVRAKLAAAGLHSVRDRYTWQGTAAVYIDTFKAAVHATRQLVHITPYYLPKLGGMERVAHELATASADAGTPVTVVTTTIGAGGAPRVVVNGRYRIERLRAILIANTPFIPLLFWRLLRFPRGALFHMHIAQAFVPEVALLAAKLRHIPFIAHFHLDTGASGKLGFLHALYKRLIFPHMLRAADRVVVFSAQQKTLVTDKYGVDVERITIIPNGVGQHFFQRRRTSPRAKPRLLFVGRLDVQKNVAFLLRSLQSISERFETHIVGDGPLAGSLQKLAQKLHLQNVHFDGRADGGALLDQYRQADVFVLPSDREGMPLVLMEAMAASLPVVATDVPGSSDVVTHGKNGLLIPLNNEAALRDALLQITGDAATYKKMRTAAKKTAQHYTWPKVASRFAALYDSLRSDTPAIAPAATLSGAVIYEARPSITAPLFRPILLLTALCAALVASGAPTLWIAPLILFILPGYILTKLIVRHSSLLERAVYIAGCSILLGEGIGLGNALLKPIAHINGFTPAWIAGSYAAITTALLLIARRRRQDTQTLIVHRLRRYANRKAILFSAACLALPVLSYLGANRLNNGFDGGVSIAMIVLSLALGGWLFWQEHKKPLPLAIPVFIFATSLAYLLMYAARSHFLIGWDIQQELGVAALTQHSQQWTIRTLQDPYNAMLSITVLPTTLATMLQASLLTVFKFVLPLLFSFMPVTVYLVARNLHRSRAVALGATLFFIGQYQFMQEMPALARQQIGFLFFGLLLVVLTSSALTKRARTALLVLFGGGMIVSHYSTAYLAIGLFAVAYAVPKILARFVLWRTAKTPVLPGRISFGFIAFLVIFAYIWNVPVTQSSSNMQQFAGQVAAAVPDHLPRSISIHWPENRTVTGGNVTNPQARQEYAAYVDKKYHLAPGTIAPAIQPAVSDAIPMRSKTGYQVKGWIQDVLQWVVRLGGIAGCVVLAIWARRRRSLPLLEVATMASVMIVLVGLIQLVPGWSAHYNIERLAQQAMLLIAPITLLALYLAAKRLSRRLVTPALYTFAGLTILLSSGLAGQAVGGTATLNINGYGEDYDRFYVTASEAAAAQWLSDNYDGQAPVFADRYAARRLVQYDNLPEFAKNDILPQTLTPDSYVYAGHANVLRGIEKNSAGQGIITFTFPRGDIDRAKNLIYSGKDTAVYK